MFYEEGLRIGEIAAIRHKSRSALKMALLRGRKAIINAVKGHASAHHDLKTPGRVE
jgi:DNA-directed RNA polymerase specialized sigma24 family protein